jgi:hypothetical protein
MNARHHRVVEVAVDRGVAGRVGLEPAGLAERRRDQLVAQRVECLV